MIFFIAFSFFQGFVGRLVSCVGIIAITQEQDQEVAQKIGNLTELMSNPDCNEGSVLRIFHDLFLLTHEGRYLPPQPPVTAEWLSGAASFFLSHQLLNVLFKLRLEVYEFQFAALNLRLNDSCSASAAKPKWSARRFC